MKRLLEQIGITYLSVLAVVFYFGNIATCVIGVLALLLFIVFMIVRKYRSTVYLPVMAFVALLGCISNLGYTTFVYNRIVDTYYGESCSVTATLVEEPYNSNSDYVYRFKTTTVNGQNEKVRFVVYSNEPLAIEPFDTISIDVDLYATDSPSYLSKGYFLISDLGYETPTYTVREDNYKPPYYYAIKLRQAIREKLRDTLSDDTFSLCSALLIGDKYALSDDVRQQFREAGVSHMIVVSGMHFSILASFFLFFANKSKRYRAVSIPLVLVFILLYMGVTGFTPSVLRSGIMLIIHSLGLLISRDSYSGNSLGVAAIAVTLFNPYSVGDVGLILSFATTYSIVLLSPKLAGNFYRRIKYKPIVPHKYAIITKVKKLCRKIPYSLSEIFAMNVSAFVASLPLSILFFGSTSTVSILSSFLLCLPVQFLLILTLIISIVSFIPFLPWLLSALSFFAEMLANLIYEIVGFFAQLPFSYVYVHNDYVYLWIALCVVLFVAVLLSDSKHRIRLFALTSTLVFLVGFVSAGVISSNCASLNIYNVGDGVAVMYDSPDTSAMLSFECKSSYAYSTVYKLREDADELDFCASVSDTLVGANSLKILSDEFAINDVLLYDTVRTVSLSDNVDTVITPAPVQTVYLSDDTKVTYHQVNDDYITYFESAGYTVLILPQFTDVAEIPEEYRTADTIVMRKCPENFELLCCDTLVISEDSDSAHHIMRKAHSVCNRALLTSESDVELLLEV